MIDRNEFSSKLLGGGCAVGKESVSNKVHVVKSKVVKTQTVKSASQLKEIRA